MDNLFLKYMKERSGQRKGAEKGRKLNGPVITISREYGCHGSTVASLLVDALNKRAAEHHVESEWRWISKEILERTANELKLSPSLVKDLSDYKHKSFFENLALFFSEEYYPGDATIRNRIANVIHEEAALGNVVVVGRAAEAITKDIKQGFHVKIEAPLDWRAGVVSKAEGISVAEAKKMCQEQDKRRAQFRDYFERGRPDIDFFDLRINASSMTDEEIVQLLLSVVEIRGF